MMMHVALVAEILATILCIHCIYGRKVTFDVKTVGFVLSTLIILEIVNIYRLNGVVSFTVCIFLFVYCISEFRSSVGEVVVSLFLYAVILTSMQFSCLFIANAIILNAVNIQNAVYIRNAVSNILLLIFLCALFPTGLLHRLQKSVCRKSKFVVVLLAFVSLIVVAMLIQGKAFYKVQMQYFVLVIPLIIMLLYAILKWFTVQTNVEKMQDEIREAEKNTKEYENLLTKVRLRQHELKNHLAAIFSTHYTYKTYEKLVQAQEEYCKRILDENKYNSLLLLGDKILVGYLHGKFQEAEDDGIEIDYKVAAKIDKVQVPTYYMIEMLGILFDNAMEALKNSHKKVICFEVCELENGYELSVRNPFPYVPYDEITEWFKLDRSEKGSGRGIGLYHLKCLCDEWHSAIECRNVEIEQDNWIAFILKVKKADNA